MRHSMIYIISRKMICIYLFYLILHPILVHTSQTAKGKQRQTKLAYSAPWPSVERERLSSSALRCCHVYKKLYKIRHMLASNGSSTPKLSLAEKVFYACVLYGFLYPYACVLYDLLSQAGPPDTKNLWPWLHDYSNFFSSSIQSHQIFC